MNYSDVIYGRFIRRPNRFIAHVDIDGAETVVHVKNTGRCGELLQPGAPVFLEVSNNPLRKTKYDLIAVEKYRDNQMPLLVNMDSQVPNDVAAEWLPASGIFSGNAKVRREFKRGNSRFDFFVEDGCRKAFMEVKGVTLEHGGTASFPDAPTERGVKHLRELAECLNCGYEAYILFVVQMKGMSEVRPNDERDPAFGRALREAAKAGVHVLAMDCVVTPDTICIDAPVKVVL